MGASTISDEMELEVEVQPQTREQELINRLVDGEPPPAAHSEGSEVGAVSSSTALAAVVSVIVL